MYYYYLGVYCQQLDPPILEPWNSTYPSLGSGDVKNPDRSIDDILRVQDRPMLAS
jgi:hypothetical protein